MKSKNTAGLLALFLWWLGIHKFYLWRNMEGIIYVLLVWTWIPMIFWIIEAFILWGINQEKFEKEYNKDSKKCKYCWETIKIIASKCRFCQEEI